MSANSCLLILGLRVADLMQMETQSHFPIGSTFLVASCVFQQQLQTRLPCFLPSSCVRSLNSISVAEWRRLVLGALVPLAAGHHL